LVPNLFGSKEMWIIWWFSWEIVLPQIMFD